MNEVEKKRTVLVTGSTGFVGRQLIKQINERNNYHIRVAIRGDKANIFTNLEQIIHIQDITANTDWHEALQTCDVVIHTAARVHVMKERDENPMNAFRRVNVEGTLNLAKQSAQQGVKRFIFISSIKVNGENTPPGLTYTPDDLPAPVDAYAISKYEAEQGLLTLGAETGMEIVIIRPPLVYGPGVKGNFQRMMNWLYKGYPLPLKTVSNKRSIVSIYNLASLIIICIDNPKAANQIFLVSDGYDLSTIELMQKIGQLMNKPVRLLPLPYWILYCITKVIGKQAVVQRLFGSLQVDISKTCDLLGWKPEISTEEALLKTTQIGYI